jgi:hypothetical protein
LLLLLFRKLGCARKSSVLFHPTDLMMMCCVVVAQTQTITTQQIKYYDVNALVMVVILQQKNALQVLFSRNGKLLLFRRGWEGVNERHGRTPHSHSGL